MGVSKGMRRYFVVLIFFAIVAMALVGYGLYERALRNEYDRAYDALGAVVAKVLRDEKAVSLSLALAISKNRALTEAVIERDPQAARRVLREMVSSLKKHLGQEYIFAQVIVPGPAVFASNDTDSRVQIFDLKKDIERLLDASHPLAFVSTRHPPGVKALVPIMYANRPIAVVEVSTLFEDMVRRGREFGMEIVPLIETRKEGAIHGYGVPVLSASPAVLHELENLDPQTFRMLLDGGYFVEGDHYFAAYGMYDYEGKVMGYFVAVTPVDKALAMGGGGGSFWERIFGHTTDQKAVYAEVVEGMGDPFGRMGPSSMVHIGGAVDREDLFYYKKRLRSQLEKLSREDLIKLFLDESTTIKRGRIE